MPDAAGQVGRTPSTLIVGDDAQAVPGVDAEALRASLDAELARFAAHGSEAAEVLVVAGGQAGPTLVRALTARPWDVVVVGGGIRKTEGLLPLFERVVNLIRRHAPQAAIALNDGIGTSVEAAQRWR